MTDSEPPEELDADETHNTDDPNESASADDDVDEPTGVRIGDLIDLSNIAPFSDITERIQGMIPNMFREIESSLPDFDEYIRRSFPDLSGLSSQYRITAENLAEKVVPALRVPELPAISFEHLIPKFDVSHHLRDFAASIALPASVTAGLAEMLERLRESLPPNWPEDVDIDKLSEVIQDEGIPLVWVPPADLITAILAAQNRSERVEILKVNTIQILEDCHRVLDDVVHESLSGQAALARTALKAAESGHAEAAQALAVVITETAIARSIGGSYSDIKKKVLFDPDIVPFTELRLRAALAPVGPFYTPWFPNSGTPSPEALSRHVTVHQADPGHYTAENSIISVMLVVSVLRALQELQELAEASDEEE